MGDEEPCFFCRETFGPIEEVLETPSGVRTLQTFEGYTVDLRLRQFRKIVLGEIPEFISFNEPEGQRLLTKMHDKMLRLHNDGRAPEILLDENGEWICLCGNVASEDGFFPCDEHGNMVEPTPEEWTTNLYRCDHCHRKINQNTLEIVE